MDLGTGRDGVGEKGGNRCSSNSRRQGNAGLAAGNAGLDADAQGMRLEAPHTPRTREQLLAQARKEFDKEREKWAFAVSEGPGAGCSSEHNVSPRYQPA